MTAAYAVAQRSKCGPWSRHREPIVTTTKTQTVIRTRVDFDRALREVRLPAQEEQVLRMRYGIVAAPETELEFRGIDQTDVQEALTRLELRALANLQDRAGASTHSVDAQRRSAIIERMRKI